MKCCLINVIIHYQFRHCYHQVNQGQSGVIGSVQTDNPKFQIKAIITCLKLQDTHCFFTLTLLTRHEAKLLGGV